MVSSTLWFTCCFCNILRSFPIIPHSIHFITVTDADVPEPLSIPKADIMNFSKLKASCVAGLGVVNDLEVSLLLKDANQRSNDESNLLQTQLRVAKALLLNADNRLESWYVE